jgi:hypothetical protein
VERRTSLTFASEQRALMPLLMGTGFSGWQASGRCAEACESVPRLALVFAQFAQPCFELCIPRISTSSFIVQNGTISSVAESGLTVD